MKLYSANQKHNDTRLLPQSDHYICVADQEQFMVHIKQYQEDRGTELKTYGAVLYLDGKRVTSKKIFEF